MANNRINTDWQWSVAELPAGYAERYLSENLGDAPYRV